MRLLTPIIMAFSCFSAVPMPHIDWDEHNMRYMMAAFPLVGAAIGVLAWLWLQTCEALQYGVLLRAAGLTLIPLLVTGGIHMDGFADVIDALSSHAEPARKREILKDPHVGAFAVMGIAAYLIAYLGLVSEVDKGQALLLACVPVISRCLSGIATVSFRRSSETGMLASEARTAETATVRTVLLALFAVTFLFALTVDAAVAALMLLAAAGTLALVKYVADTQFGGMSGDLAGYLLQVCELVLLLCIVVVGRLV